MDDDNRSNETKFTWGVFEKDRRECCKWAYMYLGTIQNYLACDLSKEYDWSDDPEVGCTEKTLAYWWPGSRNEVIIEERVSATQCCININEACDVQERTVYSWPANNGERGCGETLYQLNDSGERVGIVKDGLATE